MFSSLLCRRIVLGVALLACSISAAFAQKAGAKAITADDLRMHLSIVASDETEGRGTPSTGANIVARYLATMAATLANGGVNPVTKKKVVSPETVMYTLPVMATAGLYDDSGIWYYNSGLPGKSGVGGGLLAVCPGKFGIAVVSPPLDAAGNSVKAQLVIKYVVEKLGANPFLIQPK